MITASATDEEVAETEAEAETLAETLDDTELLGDTERVAVEVSVGSMDEDWVTDRLGVPEGAELGNAPRDRVEVGLTSMVADTVMEAVPDAALVAVTETVAILEEVTVRWPEGDWLAGREGVRVRVECTEAVKLTVAMTDGVTDGVAARVPDIVDVAVSVGLRLLVGVGMGVTGVSGLR
jgi:hypothetical protein